MTELVQIQIASSLLGIRLMVDHVTLTHAVGVQLSHPPVSSLVGNQWTIKKKGIIDESKDVAWIKQRYHLKSILQDFGYITTLTEIIPYAGIAQWRER